MIYGRGWQLKEATLDRFFDSHKIHPFSNNCFESYVRTTTYQCPNIGEYNSILTITGKDTSLMWWTGGVLQEASKCQQWECMIVISPWSSWGQKTSWSPKRRNKEIALRKLVWPLKEVINDYHITTMVWIEITLPSIFKQKEIAQIDYYCVSWSSFFAFWVENRDN